MPSPSQAAKLAGIIKSARDIMRKDKGLNGDLDRLPQLTWLMFLKFLDDVERIREAEVIVAGKPYLSLIEHPYRWRDWALDPAGITGDELISFVSNDEAMRPNGTRGPGLLTYLKSLQSSNGRDSRDVISNAFRGVTNRMLNGYLLRDVVNKTNHLDFASSQEIHDLSFLYESLLRELRDAAGDSGEFYTPRPVVRFMVQVIDPKLGESVLDPAAGTGGFLVESFLHIRKQCEDTADFEQLQNKTIMGVEAKSLPYLLCQMNLLLHGVEFPNIDPMNALRHRLNEIGDSDRVDAILTNPPFGGEEERGILSNFPEDMQTTETALLFLQLVMRRLKRRTHDSPGGRCAMVVPNGTLFATGVGARIKKALLDEFNLHTIVRLPFGVFSPYADIPTNILFFDQGCPTEEIWFYEVQPPPGRTRYTKTKPLKFEEFRPVIEWWHDRKRTGQAWKVPAEEIVTKGYNLDVKNPALEADEEIKPPMEILSTIALKEKRIAELIREMQVELKTENDVGN